MTVYLCFAIYDILYVYLEAVLSFYMVVSRTSQC